jgi:hypothetical protein
VQAFWGTLDLHRLEIIKSESTSSMQVALQSVLIIFSGRKQGKSVNVNYGECYAYMHSPELINESHQNRRTKLVN